MKNRQKSILALLLLTAALVMQILPYGAVCRYGAEDGSTHVVTYSHFDLTPYGNGNVTPFFTGVATVLWLLLSVLARICKKEWQTGRTVLGYLAFLLSLAPVISGPAYMNPWGWGIAILLCTALFLTKPPHVSKKKERLT